MITPEQIPDEVKTAVKKLMSEIGFPVRDCEALEIAAAALNAWPNGGIVSEQYSKHNPRIILPPAEGGR